MQAGLVTGKGKIELRELPHPEPEPGKAVVEIARCGICGTDVHAYLSGAPYNPAICGHEWSGTVSALGPDVARLREGDRVAIGVAPACGSCAACRAGDAGHCEATLLGMIGLGPLAAQHGGFAAAIGVEAARLYRLRDSIPLDQAAMLEPATVAVHALRRTPVPLGAGVLVIGAGPIGLLTAQAARAAGAGHVVVVEPHRRRAELAAAQGATAIDPTQDDLAARVREVFGALGPEIVFECAGVAGTIQEAVGLVRRGGTVGLVGLADLPAEIQPGQWLAREVRLVASLGYLHDEFDTAMQLVCDGRLELAPLHTSTLPLAELERGFQAIARGGDEVKVLVDPTA